MKTLPSPFPLEGGRVGDGGVSAVLTVESLEAAPPMLAWKTPASTPTQPSPLEGEGFRERT